MSTTKHDEQLEGTEDKLTLQYVFFKNRQDRQPKSHQSTWVEFCRRFSQHQARPLENGKDGLAWSPAIYKFDSTRAAANVEYITMGVLDVDDGTPTQIVLEKLQGLKYLAHSTWSHSNESPTYRVIIPFSKPVPAKEWDSYWTRLNAFAGNHNDKQVKDPSRLYFTPSHPKGSDEPFVLVGEGEYLDPASLPVPAAETIATEQSQQTGTQSVSPGLNAVLSHCRFMQWASDPANQSTVSEPLWRAMISNAARFDDEEWIHKASEHHPEYDEGGTDKKIATTLSGSDPITCRKIQESGVAAR